MSNPTIVALQGSPAHGARHFLCSVTNWEFLSDLGQTFGWHPRGSTYVTTARQRTLPPLAIRHNYQPGGMKDCKQIEADDATAWAGALGIAKHSVYFNGMIRAHATLAHSAEEPLRDMLDEFIDFARTGAFIFSLCAEPEAVIPPRMAPSENPDLARMSLEARTNDD